MNEMPVHTEVPQVRPWVRYWARMFDLYLLGTIAGMAIGLVAPSALTTFGSGELFGFACLFIWIFAESLLLSTTGTTPGKWLLKTRLVPGAATSVTYSQALERSFKVWWRGMGAGLPFVGLITLVVAHERLTKNGITSWDTDEGFTITHERIGPIRILALCLLFLAFSALVAAGIAADA